MTAKFWIHCADFVDAFVGPFPSKEAAHKHIDNIIVPRGDSSVNEVIDNDTFERESTGWLVVSPTDDLLFNPEG